MTSGGDKEWISGGGSVVDQQCKNGNKWVGALTPKGKRINVLVLVLTLVLLSQRQDVRRICTIMGHITFL